MMKHVYPGNSSYSVETGGKLQNLREITIEEVRNYHKKYYRPENFQMTITGQILPEELFEVLERTEEKSLKKRSPPPEGSGPLPTLKRPFIRDLIPLDENKKVVMKFPSDDEEFGWVKMGWRLVGNVSSTIDMTMDLTVLHSYLTSTSASPFTKAFIDIADPIATGIDYDLYMNWEPCIVADFYNVPVKFMEKVEDKYNQVIQNIIESGDIDMERLHTIGTIVIYIIYLRYKSAWIKTR